MGEFAGFAHSIDLAKTSPLIWADRGHCIGGENFAQLAWNN